MKTTPNPKPKKPARKRAAAKKAAPAAKRKAVAAKTEGRTWRSIEQSSKKKVVTSIARRRRLAGFLKVWGACTVGALAAVGFSFGGFAILDKWNEIKLTGPSQPLRQVVFETDGVLPRSWFEEVVTLREGIGLMDVDHVGVKDVLERQGQVRSATVSKEFPDTLRVSIRERRPVVKARVAATSGSTEDLLVAADGVVFRGFNIPRASLEALPYLQVRAFSRGPGGYRPVPGMGAVGELLAAAREGFPEIYSGWQVVSCVHFEGDREDPAATITVRGRRVGETLFAPLDFEGQLARLAETLRYYQGRRPGVLPRVDLSLGDTVTVLEKPRELAGVGR